MRENIQNEGEIERMRENERELERTRENEENRDGINE
jgi:hypothetical protein